MRLFFPARQLPGRVQLVTLLYATIASVQSFGAATLTVTSTADNGTGSLRDTISAASNGDTIQFDSALDGQTITLTNGELLITKNLTIQGPGASQLTVKRSTAAGTFEFRIFEVFPGHIVTIQGVTISNGRAPDLNFPGVGGGIYNNKSTLILNDCVLSGNSATYGGGIYNDGERGGIATLTITNSTISGNGANGDGNGIRNSGQSSGGRATLTITNSTISGNSIRGIVNQGSGGSAPLTISNSTISDNGNPGVTYGGGIGNDGRDGSAPLKISNCTISGNSGTAQYGAGIDNLGGTVQIGNTILQAGASGGNIASMDGTVTSDGYNLSSDNGGGFLTATGDQINTDPMLGPLQNNGGPTFTHEPLNGSPAIDAGDPNFTPPPLYDQRGFGYARVLNGRIDIGSVEVQPAFTPSPTPTATSTATPTATATATATPTATATATPVAATPTPTPALVSISGTVSYCSNPTLPPVPSVTMTLTGTSSGSTLTNGSGNYTFSSLTSGGNYTVTPTKADLVPASAGIDTVDVIAIQRHFLVLGTPLTGCKLTAADVNGVGGINTLDVIAVQRFFLGQVTGTGNTGKYQFTPTNRTYTGIVSDQTAQNYDALVLGDVATGFVHRPEGPVGLVTNCSR